MEFLTEIEKEDLFDMMNAAIFDVENEVKIFEKTVSTVPELELAKISLEHANKKLDRYKTLAAKITKTLWTEK